MKRFIIHSVVAALVGLVLILLTGCGDNPPPRGSAGDASASAQARVEVATKQADAAVVDAATKRAEADALAKQEAQARADADAAEKRGDLAAAKAAWQQAAALRVQAGGADIEAAKAEAVRDALAKMVAQAAADAKIKAEDARKEREAEAKAAELRAWVAFCRYVGLGAVIAGLIIGGLMAKLIGVKEGAWAGGLLITTGLLVVAFGDTVTWLPLTVVGAGALSLGAWALFHHRGNQVGKALSHLVDTIEDATEATVHEAKAQVGTTMAKAGGAIQKQYAKARESWRIEAEPTSEGGVS